MANFDFDRQVDRRNTLSYKWDSKARFLGESDVLPMWVADMDFRCPEPMLNALRDRIEHGILGYTKRGDNYLDIMQDWFKRRFQWELPKEAICYCPPGVIPAVSILLDILTKPGDPVIMHMPNYDSLYGSVEAMGRKLVKCPLKKADSGYSMDLDLFEKLVKEYKIRLMIFCSPHNPTGRVWRMDELTELARICKENNIITISDEVHCDIVHKPNVHIPFGKIPTMEDCSITLMSPNKSFNVGGLMTASVIIPNKDIMASYRRVLGAWAMNLDTTFGTIAVETLYSDRTCEEWLDAVVEYIEGNLDHAVEYINGNIKGVRTLKPEGTYLLWLDFTESGLAGEELNEFLIKKAHLDLSEGTEFDPTYTSHMRMNLACTRATLDEALLRLKSAMDAR